MIEILEKSKPFVIRCNKCGCKFQYEYTDLDAALPNKIKCPECGELNLHVVKDDDKPPVMNDRLAPEYFKTIPYTLYDPTRTPAPDYGYIFTCKNEI